MSTNVFVLAKNIAKDVKADGEELDGITDTINDRFGYKDPDVEEPVGYFEWCMPFKPQPVLSVDEALNIGDAAAPYGIVDHDGKYHDFTPHGKEKHPKSDDWKRVLKEKATDETVVIFMKARGAPW